MIYFFYDFLKNACTYVCLFCCCYFLFSFFFFLFFFFTESSFFCVFVFGSVLVRVYD